MNILSQLKKADITGILGAAVVILVGLIIYLTTRQVPEPVNTTNPSNTSTTATDNTFPSSNQTTQAVNSPSPSRGSTGNTNLNTATWITYINPTEGFSIKYPLNWTSKIPANTTNTVQFGQIGKIYFHNSTVSYAITIIVEPNPQGLAPSILAAQRNHTHGKITSITINGETGAQLVDYLGTKTYFTRNKKLYTIITPEFGNEDPNKIVLSVYKTMLQTFRFTN